MIGEIAAALRDRWAELRLPGDRPTDVHVHLDSGDPRPHGFVVFRAFRSGDVRPLCEGRIPRDGLGTRDALHEHELLTSLRDESLRTAHRLFPRPLFVIDRGARVATARTAIPGEPGTTAVRGAGGGARRVDVALGWGSRWLAAFGRGTGLLEGTERALWEPFLRSVHYERQRVGPDTRGALDALAAAIEARRDGVQLCGFGHGALALAALRVAGDHVGVVDWEHGRSRQAAWADPIHFALDVALRASPSPADAARRVADADDAIGAFVRERLDDVGASPDLLPFAIPAVALAAAHRVDRNGPARPSADAWRDAARAALVAGVASAAPV
jgi:hypothetical protein